MTRATIIAALAALVLATAALASATSRPFIHRIGVYEQAVDKMLAAYKNTGTRCQFRSGKTVVYCLTDTTTAVTYRTVMRRATATKIRVVITLLGVADSYPESKRSRTFLIPGA